MPPSVLFVERVRLSGICLISTAHSERRLRETMQLYLRDATHACRSSRTTQISARRHEHSSLYQTHETSLARHPRIVAPRVPRHASMQPGASSPAARAKRGRHNAKPSGVPPEFDTDPLLTEGMRAGPSDDVAGPSWRMRCVESRRRQVSDLAVVAETLPPPPPPTNRPRNRVLEIGNGCHD